MASYSPSDWNPPIAPLKKVVSRHHVRQRIWRETLECGHLIESTQLARAAERRRCPFCPEIEN